VKFAVDVSTKEATYEGPDILKAFFPDFFLFKIIFSSNKSGKSRFQARREEIKKS